MIVASVYGGLQYSMGYHDIKHRPWIYEFQNDYQYQTLGMNVCHEHARSNHNATPTGIQVHLHPKTKHQKREKENQSYINVE